MTFVVGSTAVRLADTSTLNTPHEFGIRIETKRELVGLRLKISNNSNTGDAEVFRLRDVDGNILLTKDISMYSTGDTFDIIYNFEANTIYRLTSININSVNRPVGRRLSTTFPFTSDDVDIISGATGTTNVTENIPYFFLEVTALLPPPPSEPKLYKHTLNNIDVQNFVVRSRKIDRGQPVKTAEVILRQEVANVISINDNVIGKSITIQRGEFSPTERFMFRGEVVRYRKNGSVYELFCACKMNQANRLEEDYIYDIDIDPEEGKGSEIAKSLFNKVGINTTSESVPDTGDVNVFNRFQAKDSILKSLTLLAEIYGREIFYSDSENLGYFIEPQSVDSGLTLETGENIVGRVLWSETGEDIINNITVVGGRQVDWATEEFAGPTDEVTLTVTPIDTEITADSVKLDRGPDSRDPRDFYVDKTNRKVIFTNTQSNISVRYSYSVPIKVRYTDNQSITDTYRVDRTRVDTKLQNTDDAEIYGRGVVDDNKDVLNSAPIRVRKDNTLEVGQKVRIIDNINDIDTELHINSITTYYPYRADEIDVGFEPLDETDKDRKISERLAEIERQTSDSGDISVKLVQEEHTLNFNAFVLIEKADMDTDVLYWDSDTQSDWDDYDWGDDTEETFTEVFKEAGYDD